MITNLSKDEKRFLRYATRRHILEVEKNMNMGEPLFQFTSEEKYVEFLEKLMKKL